MLPNQSNTAGHDSVKVRPAIRASTTATAPKSRIIMPFMRQRMNTVVMLAPMKSTSSCRAKVV